MSRFLNPVYRGLKAYVPGEQPRDKAYIKLNTNESPFPPSPEVLAAVGRAELEDLRLYPDPEGVVLRESLAGFYGVDAGNVFLSNGSDDILNFAFMAFAGNEVRAAFADITYGFYKVYADLHGIGYDLLPLKDDYTLDYRDYLNLGKFIVIANPNAPTGIGIPASQIEEIVKCNRDNVVLVDEAYVDFGGESCVPLTKKYDNLLVTMTYSKSRCMAGARLGFAIGSRVLIEDLEKLKYSTNPYSVSRLTLICGKAAVDSSGYYLEKCAEVCRVRDMTGRTLEEMGFSVLPSSANFVFAGRNGEDGGILYQRLRERGILVRHFTGERIRQFNRITIGTEEQMRALLSAVKDIYS
jgi:histidinol-phosphate aminotransferase